MELFSEYKIYFENLLIFRFRITIDTISNLDRDGSSDGSSYGLFLGIIESLVIYLLFDLKLPVRYRNANSYILEHLHFQSLKSTNEMHECARNRNT